ncbi:MAG TPA: DUF3499 family protein [Pseudoclavibacter sp.]|nr:DUF3499 family protein [Pseudoclavibacter sp.]
MTIRTCSKVACPDEATATMTYDYDSSTVVIGPLSMTPVPGGFDLCTRHADALTAPRGWQLIRHIGISAG